MAAERSWLDKLLDRILANQLVLARELPAEARLEARGRKGRFVITGNPSTVRYFRWTGAQLLEEMNPLGCRNTIELHVDTLLDMLRGDMKPREAASAGLIRVTGDLPQSQNKVTYDREEFLQVLDSLVEKLTATVKI